MPLDKISIDRLLNMLKRETLNNQQDVVALKQALLSWDPIRGLEYCSTEWNTDINPDITLPSYVTIKTLAWLAKRDSHELYQKWNQEWYFIAMVRATSGLDTDLVEAIYRIYWLDYVYTSGRWYTFEGIWIPIEEPLFWSRAIAGLIRRYEFIRTELSKQCGYQNPTVENVISRINNIIQKIQRPSVKIKLLKGARDQFFVESFNEHLDSQNNLFGLRNITLEVGNCGEIIFRQSRPEDFISMCLGVRYPFSGDIEFSDSPTAWCASSSFKNVLAEIFPFDEGLTFIQIQYDILVSRSELISLPCIYIPNDTNEIGDALIKILLAMWGQYAEKVSSGTILKGQPKVKKERSMKTRLQIVSLIDEIDPISEDRLLNWFEQKPHKLIVCNIMPDLQTSYTPIKEHFKLLPGCSVHIPDDKIPEYASSLMSYLINHQQQILEIHPTINEVTLEFWKEQNNV